MSWIPMTMWRMAFGVLTDCVNQNRFGNSGRGYVAVIKDSSDKFFSGCTCVCFVSAVFKDESQ